LVDAGQRSEVVSWYLRLGVQKKTEHTSNLCLARSGRNWKIGLKIGKTGFFFGKIAKNDRFLPDFLI
jgi:hypothetical protein